MMRDVLVFYLTVNQFILWISASKYDISDKCPVQTLTRDEFEREIVMDLTFIKLDSCEIKILDEDSFRYMSHLKYLSIMKNSIKDLIVGTFQDTLKLKIIYLCHNKISELKNGIFTNLVHTTELLMYDNHLASIEADVFSDMQSLKILDLGGNWITVLDADIFRNNRQLEILELNNNYIAYLHKNIFKNLSQLKKLNIQTNRILSIQKELFSNLVNLQELILNHNGLRKIEMGSFKNNQNLTKIALNDNQLSHLDDRLFTNLKHLEYIFVSNNFIKHFHMHAKNQILITDTVTVAEGGHVSFTCNISGEQVHWLHGNHTINNNGSLSVNDPKYSILTEVKNNTVCSTIFISDVRNGDDGMYTCQALDFQESEERHFELKIIKLHVLNLWLIFGFTALGFLVLLCIVRITISLLLKKYACVRSCESNEVSVTFVRRV